MKDEDLVNRFTYHKPENQVTVENFVEIRKAALSFARLINRKCNDSLEKSKAITKLDEVVFWTNAAIARHEESK